VRAHVEAAVAAVATAVVLVVLCIAYGTPRLHEIPFNSADTVIYCVCYHYYYASSAYCQTMTISS
jgi:hypothetical protein